MNPSTLIGIVASIVLLGVVIFYTAVDPTLFLDIPSILIVLVGTLAATFISYPLPVTRSGAHFWFNGHCIA